ncbi:gp53-like domain-containing protein [Solilutibacter silvestris]|uniref:gp53-like domain-containing protein n=1 Tax=Solilutibacter silvestris TaxID=1645665 RepID=UPI003D32C77C
MTQQNDFLPFAAGGSANVLAQASYASDPATTNGFQTGVAKSNHANKALRQATIMASVIAQFIIKNTTANVIDDGTLTTIEANLEAAILQLASGRVIHISDVINLQTTLNGLLSITGNAASASKLASVFNLALTGDITGGANIDGSGNVSLATTFAKNSDRSLAQNGWGWTASGLLEQWGYVSTNYNGDQGLVSVTFPKAFPTNCFNIQTTDIIPSSGGYGDQFYDMYSQVKGSPSLTGFTASLQAPVGGSAGNHHYAFFYKAIGN